MNQSTSKTNAAPEGSANGETPVKASPQRRYRRSSRPKPAATQPDNIAAAATPIVETSRDLPTKSAASKPPSTSRAPRSSRINQAKSSEPAAGETPPAPSVAQPSSPASAAPSASPQRPRSRSQRNGRRKKGEVHLVVAATPETAETEPMREAAANGTVTHPVEITQDSGAGPITPATVALPEPVPVLTEPTTGIPTRPGQVREQLLETPADSAEPTASRRYRFDRRAAAAESSSLAPAIRPERLSGMRSPLTPITEVEVPAAPEPTSTPVPPAMEESFNLFTPRTERPYTHTTADDILSELGLRDTQHGVQPRGEAEVSEESGSRELTAELDEVPELDGQAEEIPEARTSESEGGEPESGEPENGESEGIAASTRRRRRRRRTPRTTAVETPESTEAAEASSAGSVWPSALPDVSEPARRVTSPSPAFDHYTGHDRYTSHDQLENYTGAFEQPYPATSHAQPPNSTQLPQSQPVSPVTLPAPQGGQPSWDISTAQQNIRQQDSPFGAPAPTFARGFGPQPRGVASQARDVYAPRPTRTERGTDTPPMSSNQLANIVATAIAQQTDRLLTEMRRQQYPPSMTVMFPPSASTERVGIFVDVANLLFSSRSLRINSVFGKLLEFLRGNRLLIRAHAYAPTNPDPGADQSFLVAVTGMGYRITTKNYKTFSSGAKKADLDLDLCMDIVRLVDAGALDTVALVSGDSDFLPLLEYCSDRGVRVEAAAFDDSAARILRQSCDLFINLTLAPDIRADR
ncbi:MAG: NYN domain-containing protein [Ktedonobacterales bacterium]